MNQLRGLHDKSQASPVKPQTNSKESLSSIDHEPNRTKNISKYFDFELKTDCDFEVEERSVKTTKNTYMQVIQSIRTSREVPDVLTTRTQPNVDGESTPTIRHFLRHFTKKNEVEINPRALDLITDLPTNRLVSYIEKIFFEFGIDPFVVTLSHEDRKQSRIQMFDVVHRNRSRRHWTAADLEHQDYYHR